MFFWGWKLLLLPKQLPLFGDCGEWRSSSPSSITWDLTTLMLGKGGPKHVCGCPSDGPRKLYVMDLWSTSGSSGMNHAVKCIINVTRCIIDFCDLRLLQAVCWEKSFPDCAHANFCLWSHSFWFPLQHYFHTPVCCSLSLNFLLLQVVWLQHSIPLLTPLQGWENIQIRK